MGVLDLLIAASNPVLKVLILTALGSFLALDCIDIIGEDARKHLNNIVFFVFNPALVGSNLAKTITYESMVKLWFMPLNILITFIFGSLFGWVVIQFTKPATHLRGLVVGCCAAGNMGNMLLIIIPAVCKEKGSPFGAPDVCYNYGLAYASLSMAIGAIYLWSYVYNIVRISSTGISEVANINNVPNIKSSSESSESALTGTEPLIPLNGTNNDKGDRLSLPCTTFDGKAQKMHEEALERHLDIVLSCDLTMEVQNNCNFYWGHKLECLQKYLLSIRDRIKHNSGIILRKINLKRIFAPSTSGALVGFTVGLVPPIRKSFIGDSAPLRVIQNSALLLGEGSIPSLTLIVGANLLKGLRGSGVQKSLIAGIIIARYIAMPLIGIFVVRRAVRFGLVHSDPLYQFVLLLQYAVPPAMNIGTITQLFGAGETECSVILLWSYGLASISLTLWSTIFMLLVA